MALWEPNSIDCSPFLTDRDIKRSYKVNIIIIIIMKIWIVCVLLCTAFTLRSTTAAAIETQPEQDQKLPVENKEEALEADAAAEAAAVETQPEQDQNLLVKSDFCPSGWVKYRSRCFRLMRSSQPWLGAEAQCAAQESRLASVRNIGEHNFLQGLLDMSGISQAWFGAFYFQGAWLWADSARFSYTNWYSLSSVTSYPCAYMRNNVGWSNGNCASSYPYICAIDLNTCYKA